MGKSLDEVMDALPADRRKEVEARADELIEEELTLRELRKKLNLTQEDLAGILDIRQGVVSKVENRTDLRVSTLRNYIEAMGGELELVAKIPGHPPVKLEGFQDLSG